MLLLLLLLLLLVGAIGPLPIPPNETTIFYPVFFTCAVRSSRLLLCVYQKRGLIFFVRERYQGKPPKGKVRGPFRTPTENAHANFVPRIPGPGIAVHDGWRTVASYDSCFPTAVKKKRKGHLYTRRLLKRTSAKQTTAPPYKRIDHGDQRELHLLGRQARRITAGRHLCTF